VAITKGPGADTIRLWFIKEGLWRDPKDICLLPGSDGRPVSLDTRLKEIAANVDAEPVPPESWRPDHLAILSRWFYADSREGEWLPAIDMAHLSWRKLVNAISRVSQVKAQGEPA
jgi:hypothetical protein